MGQDSWKGRMDELSSSVSVVVCSRPRAYHTVRTSNEPSSFHPRSMDIKGEFSADRPNSRVSSLQFPVQDGCLLFPVVPIKKHSPRISLQSQLFLLLHLRGDDFLIESQLSEHFHLLLPPFRDLMSMRLAAQVRAANELI